MVLESIANFFMAIKDYVVEFIILVLMIIYSILFLVVQYYMMKMIIFIGKMVWNFPLTRKIIDIVSKDLFGLELNRSKKADISEN